MAVFRVNRNKNYTHMANYHFREKEMSLKAKGLLSLMLSLPEEWDYSANGLAALSKDGKDSVKKTLIELERFGYLKRTKTIDEKGRFAGYDYDIFEKPITESPLTEKPSTENPLTEKPPQLNTKQSSTKKVSTKESNTKRKQFVPPTLEEVENYCKERKNNVDAKRFWEYFDASGWVDSNGKPVRNWKQKIITWESYAKGGKANGGNGQPASGSGKTYGHVI